MSIICYRGPNLQWYWSVAISFVWDIRCLGQICLHCSDSCLGRVLDVIGADDVVGVRQGVWAGDLGKTTTTSLMVFIRQQWLSTLQGSYSDWTFDVFADSCSHKISCHLGSQWPWVLTRVMIFADYWLEPIMIIRAREHGNEVTARLRSQISPHHPVPTTQQLQQHFKNWSAC